MIKSPRPNSGAYDDISIKVKCITAVRNPFEIKLL